MSKPDLPIIILAAGASSRMQGRDKLMEIVDNVPLLRLQALKALDATEGPVLVALPPSPHPRYDALGGLRVETIPVPDADAGMNASLRTAFAALPDGTTHAMLLLADLPDVTSDDLRMVAEAVDLKADFLIWRGSTEAGKHGHPIVFKADLFSAFASLKGDGGGHEVVALAKGRIKPIRLQGDRARHDLDTPEDWQIWRAGKKR